MRKILPEPRVLEKVNAYRHAICQHVLIKMIFY